MKVSASVAAVFFLAAGAASAQEARIPWGDLDLASAAGADAFDARVDAAARKLCRRATRPNSRINDQTGCRAAVRAEALNLLPGWAQIHYARSRRPLDI